MGKQRLCHRFSNGGRKMTIKQQIEFAIGEWMKTKDTRKKALVLLWSEDIPEIANRILVEINYALAKESVFEVGDAKGRTSE